MSPFVFFECQELLFLVSLFWVFPKVKLSLKFADLRIRFLDLFIYKIHFQCSLLNTLIEIDEIANNN